MFLLDLALHSQTLQLPPANDSWTHAEPVSGTNFYVYGTFDLATLEAGEPAGDGWHTDSIWYRWTAEENGSLGIGTELSLGLSILGSIYAGDTLQSLVPVLPPSLTSDLSPTGSGTWSSQWARVRHGITYYIRFSAPPTHPLGLPFIGGFNFVATPDGPTNDFFAHAMPLSGYQQTVIQDNTWAGLELGESLAMRCNGSGKTLWYSYTAPHDGTLYMTCTLGEYPGICHFLSGTQLANLRTVAVDCLAREFPKMKQGQTLFIAAEPAFNRFGEMTVQMEFIPSPVNDDFINRIQLEGTNITFDADLRGATEEAWELNAGGLSAWYSYSTTMDSIISFGATGFVNVYQGESTSDLMQVSGSLDGDFFLKANTLYQFQVTGNVEVYRIKLTATPLQNPAANDHFTNATPLVGRSPYNYSSVMGATVEAGEPRHRDGIYKTIWWEWSSPSFGPVRIFLRSREGMEAAGRMGLHVYEGTSIRALKHLATWYQGIEIPGVLVDVVPGNSYRIAASIPLETEGDVLINISHLGYGFSFQFPGNIVCEPSFEVPGLDLKCWSSDAPFTGVIQERRAPDGITWLNLHPGRSLWQHLPTIPERDYLLQFTMRGEGAIAHIHVNGVKTGVFTNIDEVRPDWQWIRMPFRATQTNSELKIISAGQIMDLDSFSVTWNREPPTIFTQPDSADFQEGMDASLAVGARGQSPLHFSWFFDGNQLPDQTDEVLRLHQVSPANSGHYWCLVSNSFGIATSRTARLSVLPATSPQLVLQPYSSAPYYGSPFHLSARAVGTPPLYYQWFRNGTVINGATNQRLHIVSASSEHNGIYSVLVSNLAQSVLSFPAKIEVQPDRPYRTQLRFANFYISSRSTLNAPIYDHGGRSRLGGDAYHAQLYLGTQLANLQPVGQPVSFDTGYGGGYIIPSLVSFPSDFPGQSFIAQMRAWHAAEGETYEEARAMGGSFGSSEVFTVAPDPLQPESLILDGLKSFSLRSGLPQFSVGRIQATTGLPDDNGQPWMLNGARGFRYAIEQSIDGNAWTPSLILTNVSGSERFTSPIYPNARVFLRARILD